MGREDTHQDVFSLVVPQNPETEKDPKLQELERQYHDAFIELKEVVRAYNQRVKELEGKK